MGKPQHFLAAGGAGLGISSAVGAGLVVLGYGLFGIFIPILAGLVTGTVILKAAKGLGHRPFQIIAAITTFVGLMVSPVIAGLLTHRTGFVTGGWLLGSVIAAGVAAWRVGR